MNRIVVTLVLAILASGTLGGPVEARGGFFHFLRAVFHPRQPVYERGRHAHRYAVPSDASAKSAGSYPDSDANVANAKAVPLALKPSTEPTGSEMATIAKAGVERASLVATAQPAVVETNPPAVCRKYSAEADGLVPTPCD